MSANCRTAKSCLSGPCRCTHSGYRERRSNQDHLSGHSCIFSPSGTEAACCSSGKRHAPGVVHKAQLSYRINLNISRATSKMRALSHQESPPKLFGRYPPLLPPWRPSRIFMSFANGTAPDTRYLEGFPGSLSLSCSCPSVASTCLRKALTRPASRSRQLLLWHRTTSQLNVPGRVMMPLGRTWLASVKDKGNISGRTDS